jgi:AcrR family transcriptional regulator
MVNTIPTISTIPTNIPHEGKRPDRRIQRTRRLLRDALMALILENGYDAVTIQDITDRANLGRATFYLHYRDKEELLLNSLQDIYDELVATVECDALATNKPGDDDMPGLVAFQHAAQHRDLYRVMLGGQAAAKIEHRIRDYLAEAVKCRMLTLCPEAQLPIPVDLIAQHCAGSMLALIEWWLDHDLPYTPEYMAQTFRILTGRVLLDYQSASKPETPIAP